MLKLDISFHKKSRVFLKRNIKSIQLYTFIGNLEFITSFLQKVA